MQRVRKLDNRAGRNTMRLLIVALLLVGCATPGEVRQSTKRSTHELRQGPQAAAYCILRNAEEHRSWHSADVRPNGERFEFVGRSAPEITLVVVDVSPSGSGSRATVYLREAWFIGHDELVPALVKGC